MKKIIFNVVSDTSGMEYEVVAEPTEHGLSFRCSCAAGEKGQLCKHRQGIINGPFPSSQINEAEITAFNEWLATSRISAMQINIAQAEEDLKQAKKRVTMLKHELGRRMEEGTA